ncbi:hypothetical protein KW803_03850 [Candidatus Saccharibacteria bacterium]|nr:hypothetical protein [Candidatus Saccharibacteria bacterium]
MASSQTKTHKPTHRDLIKHSSHFSKAHIAIVSLIFAAVGGAILVSTFAANPNLPGDVNNDNVVDITDLSTILTYFNTTDARGDADSSGRVDITDLSIVLSHYGQRYSPAPTVSISASPSTISSGTSSTISWSSTNATACTASGAWSGTKAASGSQTVTPTSNSTYSLSCSGTNGSAIASATVTVSGGGGSFIFKGDYEAAGNAPWTQISCSNYGYALGVNGAIANFGPFYKDTAGATHNGDNVSSGQGTYFGEFSIPADTTHKQRCQNAITTRPTTINAGEYFSLMVYVPVGWTPGTSAWGPAIAELNYQTTLTDNSGKPLALTLKPDHVTLNMNTGKMNSTGSVFSNTSDADLPATCKGTLLPCAQYVIPPGKLVQGAWNEIIVYDYFTTSNTGIVLPPTPVSSRLGIE